MGIFTEEYAQQQDEQCSLRHLRDSFVIPTKGELKRKTVTPSASKSAADDEESVYLCGNSLGLQPKLARKYFDQYLGTWATKGVYGHFTEIEDTNLAQWLNVDDDLAQDMANVVGAKQSEVAVMNTLTVNLHLMMASFFTPTKDRYKIILEGKAFPSDHFAVESALKQHNLDVDKSMVLIEPPSKDSSLLPMEHILSIIDQHASETALLLLPGIQFYSGQLFDIQKITAYAKAKGITVGWDCAHAAGNVPLKLHDWDVDFAVWCTYKYMNSGPGSVGGCFVHEKHGQVTEKGKDANGQTEFEFRDRLSGWWGSSKDSRFTMNNHFHPIAGARGYQISNTSVADTIGVRASLDVYKQTSMQALREKSLKCTKYLEDLLELLGQENDGETGKLFSIITPRVPEERGAQLSVLLVPGLLDSVMHTLEEEGVVLDERKPDVIRVAPAPLYNNHSDVYRFTTIFRKALEIAVKNKGSNGI